MATISPVTLAAGELTLAAGQAIDVMAGTPYEFSGPRGNTYTVAATSRLVGVVIDVFFGPLQIADAVGVRATAAIGVAPTIPDDIRSREFAQPGQKIRVIVNNLNAAANGANVLVDIT